MVFISVDNTIVFEAPENFGVPVSVVDKYLGAPETELRLILFLLRNSNKSFLMSELCEKIGADQAHIAKAFSFWVDAGILYEAGGRYSIQRPKVSASEIIRYSADRIAARIDGDDKVKFLYKVTEDALKKPLTTEDASAILSLIDWIGLPAEVAAMLIKYCGEEKYGMRKILSTGIDWSERGIDTYEKAEEHISVLQQKRSVVGRVSSIIGIRGRTITEPEKKVFLKWIDEFGFGDDMIAAAYEATIQNTGKYAYAYMDKILQSWSKSGFKTAADVKNASDETAKKSTTGSAAKTTRNSKKHPERKVKLDKEAVTQLSWEILTEDDE